MARGTAIWTNTDVAHWESGDLIRTDYTLAEMIQDIEHLAQLHNHGTLLTSSMSYAQGTYTGDGSTSDRLISVPFQPKVVIVKADHAANGHALIRTDTLSQAENFTNTTTTQAISSLVPTGFNIKYISTDGNGRSNETGKTYYWQAWGDAQVVTGTYLGDGIDDHDPVLGLASAPVVVIVIRTATATLPFRTTSMGANAFDLALGAGQTDTIKSLTASSITLGTDTDVNQNGVTYHYIALLASANLSEGTYAGNGSDNRTLPAAAMAFNPDCVFIRAAAVQSLCWHTTALAGDLTLIGSTGASAANKIQSLTIGAGQFQVGTDNQVNSGALSYFWFAFDEATGSGVSTDAPGGPLTLNEPEEMMFRMGAA